MKCTSQNLNQTSSQESCKNFPVTKWMGRQLHKIDRTINFSSTIIDALAYCLFRVAANSVFFTSSRSFKKNCDFLKIKQSRETLTALGGEEIKLTMPDGHLVSAIYLDAKNCLDVLISKGAEKRVLDLSDQQLQEILWIPPEQTELRDLLDRMGFPFVQNSQELHIPLGIPKNSDEHYSAVEQSDEVIKEGRGTVIYAPGSGHLFEFRRKTIGTFLIGYGMNILVLNYSETGTSEGKISSQTVSDNMEFAYQHLVKKNIQDNKILGYGHCMGGGPILDLASNHPINVLIDRTYLDLGEFAKLRVIKYLGLPSFLHFLTSWIIQPVMNRCFPFDNINKIKLAQGRVAVLGATDDELIPQDYIQKLFDNAVSAQYKTKIIMNANHDMNLVVDETNRLELGEFLASGDMLGY